MKLSDFSEQRHEIFAIYGKKESDLQEDIRILREWMLKLPHLPSDLIGDNFLEISLLKNKFSIEKCKQKIEMYFTLKADPHFDYVFQRIPIPSEESSFHTPLPGLTAGYKRLVIFRVYDEENLEMMKDLNNSAVLKEFLMRHDYNDGEIRILDLRKCSINILSKLRMNVIDDSLKLLKGGSARVAEIHVISKIGKTIFSTITPLLPKKLSSRLHFHDDVASLKMVISAEYLPSDYGGELKSLEKFNADWDTIFEENQEYLRTLINTKSREELRLVDAFRYEGIQGTFKKLNID